jgi:hypothetical protein
MITGDEKLDVQLEWLVHNDPLVHRAMLEWRHGRMSLERVLGWLVVSLRDRQTHCAAYHPGFATDMHISCVLENGHRGKHRGGGNDSDVEW